MASRRLKSGAEAMELLCGMSKLDMRRQDRRRRCTMEPSRDNWRSRRPLEGVLLTPVELWRVNCERREGAPAAPEDAELSEPGDLGAAGSSLASAAPPPAGFVVAMLLGDLSTGEDMVDLVLYLARLYHSLCGDGSSDCLFAVVSDRSAGVGHRDQPTTG